jgi:hypothetical protein
MNKDTVDALVFEVLRNFGTKERFSGVVTKVDGTTTFIKSGDREFLAWTKPELPVGTPVEFSIDQLRAKDVKVRNEC